jgi:hypothetical protein
VVQQGQRDLHQVQADALWVKLVGRRVWMAMAMAVPSRLWLGGVLSPHRDLVLIPTLVQLVRSCGRSLAILVCVDGPVCDRLPARVPVPRGPANGRRGWSWRRACGWGKSSSGRCSGGWRASNTEWCAKVCSYALPVRTG